MANPYVEWTDAQGLCRLTQLAPRFGGWTPDGDPVGPRHAALGTGRPYVYEYRRDYSVRFTVGNFAPWQEAELVRFKLALEAGLAITVFTGDSLGNTYTCYLREGATPSIQQDPETLDLSITVELINSALAPIIAQYGLAALVVSPDTWPAFLGGSFTTLNGNARRYVDKNGVGQVITAANVPRNAHYVTTPVGQRRVLLLEGVIDNYVTYSEDSTHWTLSGGTGTSTPGQADPFGGTSGVLLNDTDATNASFWRIPCAAAPASVALGYAIYADPGTALATTFMLFDTIGAVPIGQFTVTWATLAISNVTQGIYINAEKLSAGYYRLYAQSNTATSGNGMEVRVYPASATSPTATGSVTVFGAQVSKQQCVGSYVPTTGASIAAQNNDSIAVPMALPPGSSTFYARWVDLGGAARFAGAPRILRVGSAGSGSNPRLLCFYRSNVVSGIVAQWLDASGIAESCTVLIPITLFDEVELVAVLTASGTIVVYVRTNGGAWVTGNLSPANVLPAAWQTPQFIFPGYSSNVGLPILGLERWAVLPFVVNDPDEAATEAR